ncbi:MATE family efflux transporter [Streptococcus caprae]|uniref:Probable multidrug resistance protein NorM n=1 Tax=Streptococcus caprae TaxID=1640501 RepID=A0ABV8CYH9_9STRE
MNDLTQGKPLKVILAFTVPLIIGSFFQLAYNFADSMIVGQILGQTAFASVGATGSITFLILGFAQGLTAGLSIVTAQRFGAKDYDGLKRSFVHGLSLSLGVGLVLTVLALTFLHPLLELMQTPAELIDQSQAFLTAIFGGAIFTVLYNYLSNVIRALGDAKTPLYALIFACLVNVFLDFSFILNFHMGVFGAGLATIIAQALSVGLLVLYIHFKLPYFQLKREDLKLNKKDLQRHVSIGFPMGFQASIIAIGSLTLQVALNKLGTDAIAAASIATRTDQLAMLPMMNLGQAISTFTAQNYGAKKYHRILEGLKQSLIVNLAWSVFYAILLITFADFFSALFIANASQNVLNLASTYYVINGICYWVLAILFSLRYFIQGLGKSFAPTLAGFMELVFRAIVAIVGLIYFGFPGVAAASPAAWFGSVGVLVPTAIKLSRKLKNGEKV